MIGRKLLLGASLLTLFGGNATAGGDAEAGREVASLKCQQCHGPDGNTPINAQTPNLAGQYADYLERALMDYKSGARRHPIMAAMSAQLSEAEVEDVSAFFSSLAGKLFTITYSD